MSEKNEWKSIESAPKDGTEIIVFHPQAGVCAAFCPGDGFAWHCMDGMNTGIGKKSGQSIPIMTSFVEPPTHWMPLPAAPGSTSSAPGDAQDERQGFETWAKKKKMPLARIGQQYDDFWVDHAWNGWQARAALVAPAAGDALDALRELLACDNLKKQIASMQVCVLETEDDVQELDAMMSDLARRQPAAWDAARAALAAQVPHKGDAA